VLDSVEYGDEHAQYLLRIPLLVLAQSRLLSIPGPTVNQANPRQVSHTGSNRCQAIAPRPEPIIARSVAEDEHQAYDDGETGYDGGREAEWGEDMGVEVDDEGCEERVEEHGDDDDVVDCAFGEAEDEGEAPGFVAVGVG